MPLGHCSCAVQSHTICIFSSVVRYMRKAHSSIERTSLNGNSFLDGDEVKFSCVANYDLFGSQRSRCVGQKWNTGIPECKGRLFSYSLHCRHILAYGLSFDNHQAKDMKRGDGGKKQHVTSNWDYVNVDI